MEKTRRVLVFTGDMWPGKEWPGLPVPGAGDEDGGSNKLYHPLTKLQVREGCSTRKRHWLPGSEMWLLGLPGQGLDLLCPPLLPCQPHSACTESIQDAFDV